MLCFECNTQMSSFYYLFVDSSELQCSGIGCAFQVSAYRVVFSISSPSAGYEDMDSESADFCAAGKTIVADTCHSFIENTMDLRYDLKFKLEVVESVFEKNVVGK